MGHRSESSGSRLVGERARFDQTPAGGGHGWLTVQEGAERMGLVRALPPFPRSRPAWAEATPAVPDVRWSPARRASLPHLRTQARFGLGRLDEALVSTGKRVAAYRRLAPTRRERALVRRLLGAGARAGRTHLRITGLEPVRGGPGRRPEGVRRGGPRPRAGPARHRAAAAYPALRRSGPLPRGHRRPDRSAHDRRQGRFRSTPPGIKQAARLEGAGPWRAFVAITVPMSTHT